MNTINIVNDTPSEGSWEQGEKEVSSNYISPANDEVTYSMFVRNKDATKRHRFLSWPIFRFGISFGQCC